MAAPRVVAAESPDDSPAPDAVPARKRRRSQRQVEESEQNRSAIVRSALELFAAHGYTKTTLHGVADRVGLTRQGVLHHFGSKEGLFLEVIEESRRWAGRQSEASGPSHGLDGLRKLSHFVGLSADVHVRLALTLQAEAMHADAAPHVVDYARRRLELIREQIAGLLSEAREDSAIGDGIDVDAAATLITGTITGLQVQSVVDDSVDAASAFDVLIDVLTRSAR